MNIGFYKEIAESGKDDKENLIYFIFKGFYSCNNYQKELFKAFFIMKLESYYRKHLALFDLLTFTKSTNLYFK